MTIPKLAAWKFASCDGCQLTLLDCEDELLAIAGRVEIATFLEASSATVAGPYDVSLVEGSITTTADERRIRRSASSPACWSRSAHAPPPAVCRRCATSPTSGIRLRRLREARIHRHVGDIDPGVGPRRRRLPATGLSDRPWPASRHVDRSAHRAQTTATRQDGVHGVQEPRRHLRHGRRRHPVPGPGHPRRLWGLVPQLPPRLLRVLRSGRHSQHRRADSPPAPRRIV